MAAVNPESSLSPALGRACTVTVSNAVMLPPAPRAPPSLLSPEGHRLAPRQHPLAGFLHRVGLPLRGRRGQRAGRHHEA